MKAHVTKANYYSKTITPIGTVDNTVIDGNSIEDLHRKAHRYADGERYRMEVYFHNDLYAPPDLVIESV